MSALVKLHRGVDRCCECLIWAGRDHGPARQWDCHLNATSTRIRRFGEVGDGESRSVSGAAGLENARNQRLGC
jgi:hypothetical protein